MSEDQLSCIAPRNPGCQDIIFTHFLNGIRSDNTAYFHGDFQPVFQRHSLCGNHESYDSAALQGEIH